MTLEEIKSNLMTGDNIRIAIILGYKGDKVRAGSQYVSEVLRSDKTTFKGKAKKIIEVAEAIAIRNKQEAEQLITEPTEI